MLNVFFDNLNTRTIKNHSSKPKAFYAFGDSTSTNKIKKYVSWVIWRMTHFSKILLSPFVSMEVSYEDSSFYGFQKPLILVSNHKQIFDPWIISFAFPFKILFGRIFPIRVYASMVFSDQHFFLKLLKSFGLIRFVYFIYNAISIPNAQSVKSKIGPVVDAIKNGESVLFFPEGKISYDQNILEFKRGVIMTHQLTKAPILPIAVRYKKTFSPFYKIYVSIGKPIYIPENLLKENSDNQFYGARYYLREKVLNLYQKTYNE